MPLGQYRYRGTMEGIATMDPPVLMYIKEGEVRNGYGNFRKGDMCCSGEGAGHRVPGRGQGGKEEQRRPPAWAAGLIGRTGGSPHHLSGEVPGGL